MARERDRHSRPPYGGVDGPAGLFKQDVAFRDRTGPRKRNLLRASRLGRIDKVRPIRQNMPIW